MGRPTRVHVPGTIHHVTARGNGGRDVFRSDDDRQRFLNLLAAIKAKLPFDLFAHCLLANHLHLLIRVLEARLEDIMERVLGLYARGSNTIWGTEGHVFYERYYDGICGTDAHLFAALRYIHGNPVKDGFVVRMEDWLWSSHHEYLGAPVIADTGFCLDQLGGRAGYLRLMNSFRPDQTPDDRPTLPQLQTAYRDRGSFVMEALAAGYRQAELARFLGVSRPVVTRLLRRGANI